MGNAAATQKDDPRDPWVLAAQLSLAFGLVAALPAIGSFFSAVWSAVNTGQVLVLSVGRYEISHSLVYWPLGWARFAGPLLLLMALLLRGRVGHRHGRAWWFSALLAAVALALLCFSRWFTSPGGAVLFLSLLAYTGAAHFVDKRLGRAAVVMLLLATVAVLVYVYLHVGT